MVGFLRMLSTGKGGGQLLPPLNLPENGEILIGREPSCQLSLDPITYTMVSRRHAVLRQKQDNLTWEICDLNSANGTYINGKRLQQCQVLKNGDRLIFGHDGPEFIFELATQTTPPPSSSTSQSDDSFLSLTQLFPIASTGKELTKKAYLLPAGLTVIFVVLMFAFIGKPLYFNFLLAIYIALGAYYYVYLLCGKYKPWWILLASALTTILILITPILYLFALVFRVILPGSLPENTSDIGFIPLFISMFFGAGLMEELLKAVPIFGAYWLGIKLGSPWKERIGVIEPLDGILLGTASAVGFTLLETLGQYVPNIVNDVSSQAGEGAGELLGLQLLIPRILGSVAGHMAYSGYFGYFIGLSVLKPRKRWQILAIGYLSASLIHALWNTVGSYSNFILAAVGVISYAFLAAAILKARTLSPTREQNFATHFSHKL